MKQKEKEEDNPEYWEEKVKKDKKLSFLSNNIKHQIAYFDWSMYCGYSDSKRPISKLVKLVLEEKK